MHKPSREAFGEGIDHDLRFIKNAGNQLAAKFRKFRAFAKAFWLPKEGQLQNDSRTLHFGASRHAKCIENNCDASRAYKACLQSMCLCSWLHRIQ